MDFDIEQNQQVINIQEDIRQEMILRLPVRVISDEEELVVVVPDVERHDEVPGSLKTTAI